MCPWPLVGEGWEAGRRGVSGLLVGEDEGWCSTGLEG